MRQPGGSRPHPHPTEPHLACLTPPGEQEAGEIVPFREVSLEERIQEARDKRQRGLAAGASCKAGIDPGMC